MIRAHCALNLLGQEMFDFDLIVFDQIFDQILDLIVSLVFAPV